MMRHSFAIIGVIRGKHLGSVMFRESAGFPRGSNPFAADLIAIEECEVMPGERCPLGVGALTAPVQF